MSMRPILKKLHEKINSKLNPKHEQDAEYYALSEGAEFDEAKQKGLQKYWYEHCVKLQPFEIPAGTQLMQKSSSGNWYGIIVVNCKAIGLITEVGYKLLLDRPACVSAYAIDTPPRWDDDKVTLAALPTELLKKIYEAIV